MSAEGISPFANCAAHADANSTDLAPTAFTSSWVTCLPASFRRAWTSFMRTCRYSRTDLRQPAGVAGIEGGAGAWASSAAAQATAKMNVAATGFFMAALQNRGGCRRESRRTAVSCSIHG